MDGIVVINKEKGCTSHDVVYKVKKLFGKKVGHTGTLDPNATGVLPILIGKGTELSQFLINHDKRYVATIQLGVKTDTGDVEGNVIEEKEVGYKAFDEDKVSETLKKLVGRQMQIPPMYSAIKVKGKKLYEYARSGKPVDIPAREIEIYDLKLLGVDSNQRQITYEIYCSKGTYVRTVCENIAEALGTVGYMKNLKRTMVGDFKIEDSITVDDLIENYNNEEFLNYKIISVEQFFKSNQAVILNDKELALFFNGVQILKDGIKDSIVRVYNNENNFIGIGVVENNRIKRKIVLV